MPELPEVETVARDLRRILLPPDTDVGPVIVGARVHWPRTLRAGDEAAFDAAVRGRRIEAVGRRGKQLVLELSGGAILTIHLKMTGQLFVVPATTVEDPYVRCVLVLDDGREIRFRDIRKFGRVGIYGADLAGEDGTVDGSTNAAPDPFAAVGPEPLDPAFTLRAFRERLRGRRGRLKPLLIDQAFIAGVGNIYADEALWLGRLHPLRSATSLRPADERRLYVALRTVLAEAVMRRGSSIDDYTAPEGDGSMQEQLAVYQRTGEPCPRCGRPVRRIVVGGRATHLCTWCQRLPTAERAAAAPILRSMVPPQGRAGTTPRRGRRWTELDGQGVIGRTPDEAAVARARTAGTRRAASARRAAARRAAARSATV